MDTRSAACGRSQRRTPPPPVTKAAAPWLVFPYGKDKNYESTYSSDNWNHGDCFLWNPVSLESIQLPSLLEWISKPKKYVMVDCVLTSPPASIHYHGDSTIIFLFSTPFDKKDSVLLLFCHPGEKQWRIQRISQRDITGDLGKDLCTLHCFKGKLYVTFGKGDRLLEIEEEHLLDDNVKTLSVRPLELVLDNPKFLPPGADCICLDYVESDEEFFRVWVCYNRRCKQVMSIYVWRLDFTGMKWEEMKDLGDLIIFVGFKTGVCCSAAELGLKRGGLYYTLPDDLNLYKFEVSGGNAVILPCLKLQTPWFPSEWIIMMPEDGRKRMENDGKEQQQQQRNTKDLTLKELQETFTTGGSRDEETIEEISRPWDTLNEDTLAAISTFLHPLDYVHFRSVCKANRRVMPPTTQRRGSNSRGCPHMSPWLMFPRNNTYHFVDPVHDNEAYIMSFCELLQDATVRYQKDGWLLMSREKNVFFYNPFTREIIKLADLADGCNISLFCFDDPPTASDCVVFAIDQRACDPCILITMRGEDVWFRFEFLNSNGEKLMPLHGTAPISYKSAFYCVDCDGTLGAFDTEKNDGWSVLASPKKIFNDDMHPNLLVECGGDLLLVKLGHLGTAVRIFRLDFSTMEWVRLESLGKHMLFISETSCSSAIAPNSQMENTICFPRVYLNGGGVLLYSLGTGSYHSSSSSKNQHSLNSFCETEGWLSNCTWIQPNWSKCTEQELDWLNPLC